MLNFCTLFNSNYLSRGLAMYHSLEVNNSDFHLYIVAFDEHCLSVLNRLYLKHATVISLKKFENDTLKAVKLEKTSSEYSRTCSSFSIKYCIDNYKLDHCTYIDADLLFFKDPKVLIEEMGSKSVLVTEQGFLPRYRQASTNVSTSVQLITFKNTEEGMEVLNWWIHSSSTLCSDRFDDGGSVDKEHLDEWHNKFSTIHVLKHPGGGVAPWNVQQYSFSKKGDQVIGVEKATGEKFDLIFYHYHGFRYTLNNSYILSDPNYSISRNPVKNIYRPYINALSIAERAIGAFNKGIISHETADDIQWLNKGAGESILFFLRGYYKNVYTKTALSNGFLH